MKKAKSKIKKATAVILAATMLLSVGTASLTTSAAEVDNISSVSVSSDDFEYRVMFDDTVEITKYTGSATNIVIPNEIDEKKVTDISYNAFTGCNNLKSVSIGSNISYISSSAFEGCYNLVSIEVEENNETYYSVDGILFSYREKILYKYPAGRDGDSYTIPNDIQSVGGHAFAECNSLIEITIPDGVTELKYAAFENCTNLKDIHIPDSVSKIGQSVFDGTEWYYNQPDGLIYIGKVVYEYKNEYYMPENTKMTIKEGTKGIAGDAFYNCDNISEITLPQSLEFIGYQAFSNCDSLTSITIPNSVTEMDGRAFAYCHNLTNVTLSTSLTELDSTFYDCINLKNIKIPVNLDYISSDIGYGIDGVIDGFTITGYSKSVAEWYADNNGFNFVSIGEPWLYQEKEDGSLEITGSNFYYQYEDLEVTIPSYIDGKKVTSIGESAFGLVGEVIKSVIISEGITSIGERAFEFSKFESVKLPSTLKSIGYMSFWACINLSEITIPNGVERIEDGAFGITNIKSFYIPASVIYCDAPIDFDVLNEVVVDEDNQNYYSKDGALFRKYDNILLLYPHANERTEYSIPEGTSGISRDAFMRGTGNLKELTIPGSVKVVGSGTFYGGNLDELILEEGVEKIEKYAVFNGKFKNIVIPKSVTTIGEMAVGYTNMDTLNPVAIKNFTIYGYRNTAAESYATENGFNFIALPKTENGIEYNILDDGTAEITSYTGTESKLTIPDTLNGCVVTSIGNYAFTGNTNITNVILPNSTTYIGVQAFQDCDNLIEVVLPENVKKIDIYAFDGCDNLESVNIPEGVKCIGSLAFARCNLKSITIPKSVNIIGEYALGYDNLYGEEKLFEPVKVDGFTIYGYKDTAAETYATENGFTFIALDDSDDMHLLGDVNSDGVVNVIDATVIAKHLAELENIDSELLKYADVNSDGVISIMDATEIQKISAGLI